MLKLVVVSIYIAYNNLVCSGNIIKYNIVEIIEAGRGAAAQSVTVNRLVVGSIPTRGNEIFT